MGLGTALIGLIDPIGKIGKALAEAYASSKDAETEQERIDADVRIKQLEARQAVIIQEMGWWGTRWIRPAFAYPLAFYLGKIWVWDKALGWGASDPIDENLLWVMTAIISFYFLTRPIEKLARYIQRK